MTFGVGKRDRVERVVIDWPSGRTEEFKGVQAGKAYECVEGKGIGDGGGKASGGSEEIQEVQAAFLRPKRGAKSPRESERGWGPARSDKCSDPPCPSRLRRH